MILNSKSNFINKGIEKFNKKIFGKVKVISKKPMIHLIVLATVLNFILEILSRRSLFQAYSYVTSNFIMFLYNVFIIVLTLSISLLFLRKNFMIALISTVWLGLGVANFVLLGFRTTPLAAMDFYILKSVFDIIHVYLNTMQIVIISIMFLLSIIVLAFAWRKFPKSQVCYIRSFIAICLFASLLFVIPDFTSKAEEGSSIGFGNLVDAYDEYGFVYCFSRSVVDRGINKPADYSQEYMEDILSMISGDLTYDPNISPNIIMVQLETFFDVNYLKNLTFSENPIPYFTELKSEYSSGFLTVPSIGAGTANTEFEILSGMSLAYFGAGEYPYKTILQSSTTETIGYNLSEIGYQIHAIHNNNGTFYERDIVFTNLGFHRFISIEYMNDVEYTPVGWARDNVLIPEIFKAMEATEAQDLVYAISVQGHGKYPDDVVDVNQRIKVMGALDESETAAFEYYVHQLYEMDVFVQELISQLSKYDEPVVLVLFGDHLPSLSIENQDLINGDRFQTEYVLWSNFPMEQINRDLYSYQLSAYVLERLGINNGLLTKLHQLYADEEDYQKMLLMLQYDMLYGNKYVYDGESPFPKMELQMGTTDIIINEVKQLNEDIYIKGGEFTPWSVVFVEGKAKETIFLDKNTLVVNEASLETDSTIFVGQVSSNKRILSKTPEWIFK